MNRFFKTSAVAACVVFPVISQGAKLEVSASNKLPLARVSQTIELSAADLAPLQAKTLNLTDDYHVDHGEGADFYSAGPSRGCGGSGLWAAGKLTATLTAGIPLLAVADATRSAYFSDWPQGTAPAEVGKRVAANFLTRKFRYETTPDKAKGGVIYPEVIAWYGALTLAQLTKDQALTDRLVKKFEPFLTEPGAQNINRAAHVDFRVFGALPLEIFLQTKDARCKDLGLGLADAQWGKTTPDGITAEARYWVDDMYMISVLQVQAFRATGDKKYLDRAALAMATYLDKLQQPNGLFYHAADSPFYWARGNGWYAAGMAEVLGELPAEHPHHAAILTGYRKMMAALLECQSADGLWHQLLDHPESWLETSGSGMFAFAMITGVKRGWLDAPTYGPAARKAWLALVAELDGEANVKNVCVGTNKAFKEVGPDPKSQLEFYLTRERNSGDLHGQAPLLWATTALLR